MKNLKKSMQLVANMTRETRVEVRGMVKDLLEGYSAEILVEEVLRKYKCCYIYKHVPTLEASHTSKEKAELLQDFYNEYNEFVDFCSWIHGWLFKNKEEEVKKFIDDMDDELHRVYKAINRYEKQAKEEKRIEEVKKVIERTNFYSDYDVIENSLEPLRGERVSLICKAINQIFKQLLVTGRNAQIEMFCYNVNDINYVLFDGENKELEELEDYLSDVIENHIAGK